MNIDNMPMFKVKEFEDNCLVEVTTGIYSKIVNQREKETIKLIQEYCKEHNLYCDLIDEDKLKLILKLGVEKYNQLESQYDIRSYIGE